MSHPFFLLRWPAALGIALTMWLALKLLTLRGCGAGATGPRTLAYLALWPGMNARAFLRGAAEAGDSARWPELVVAGLKLAFGLALVAWAVACVDRAPAPAVGWVGMVGILFTFHFGLFHVLSWGWRRAGFAAPALMHAPIAARSLAEFWGERWNTAFAELARRFILRPLGRRWGVPAAGAVVFLVSGVVHELAISLPARGGWGGPTLYFLLQMAGLAVEKSRLGRALGLGRGLRGWSWTLLCTAAPLPLLFHAPLLERVVLPFFRFLSEVT